MSKWEQNAVFEYSEYICLVKRINGIVAQKTLVTELVRCKECKHAHMTYGGDCKYCDMWKDDYDFCLELYLDGDFYCAYGERKESE